jgi:hypothetical protein
VRFTHVHTSLTFLVRFFLSPRYSPLIELSDKAMQTLAIIEQTVENRVRFALAYHEIISVNVIIDYPRIFLPAAFGRPAPSMVAELGPIVIESDLRSRVRRIPASRCGLLKVTLTTRAAGSGAIGQHTGAERHWSNRAGLRCLLGHGRPPKQYVVGTGE